MTVENSVEIQQEFSVKFFSFDNFTLVYEKTGNPGYHIGLPVLAALPNRILIEGGFVISGVLPSG